jgi:hypothetical protein
LERLSPLDPILSLPQDAGGICGAVVLALLAGATTVVIGVQGARFVGRMIREWLS